MWLWGCLAPHPPIIVPAVGRGREREASETIRGMDALAEKTRTNRPDVLLVLSPHAPFGDGLMFVDAGTFEGGLQKFGIGGTLFQAPGDREAFRALSGFLSTSIPMRKWTTESFQLDHASVVPLSWFSGAWGQLPPLVLANPIGLDVPSAYLLGRMLSDFKDSRKWALLASGDLSHRVTPDAPAGFHPDGRRFDAFVMDALTHSNPKTLLDLEPAFVDRAGECGLRSVLALLGLAGSDRIEVLSYEAPFGVGYGTAYWKGGEEATPDSPGNDLTGLARESIRHFLETGGAIPLERARDLYPETFLWKEKKACFVSLKNLFDGSLRGCIGTLEPTCSCLGEEIIRNAISSATRDPRFDPLSRRELDNISVSVDVLGSPEKIPGPQCLDPKRYGIIVEKGNRRGVLLPDLEGVDTVDEQMFIASRKAGLAGPEGVGLWRFTVDRYRESEDK
ncbi:MAG: AmmeMemoRadiSam system protein A [Synergistales bacterium]